MSRLQTPPVASLPPVPDALFLAFQTAIVGRYSLDRELGRGGMGVVYLARDVALDRPVAIKLLPPERAADDLVRDRFVREARLAAKLSHPHIVPIFAVDEVDGHVFYVMAHVDGETLGERVRARGPLAASEATRVLREVAWALAHAHAQGVVHRDVKPDNILLERATGRALVVDFGIAAALGTDETPAATGTPEYMSPEQAMGGDLDARTDLYALGATAYFALVGRPPFDGRRPVDIIAKQVATPPPALVGTGAAVPRRVAQLVERCLAKAPAERPASAQSLADQLASEVESRREIPALLRGFVKRGGRINAGLVAVGTYAAAMLVAPVAFASGLGSSLAILGAAVFGVPLALMTASARKVLRRGYRESDVAVAFDAEIEQLREEFIAGGGVERRGIERALRVTSLVLGLTTVTAGATVFTAGILGGFDFPVGGVFAFLESLIPLGFGVTLPAMLGHALFRHRRPHATPEEYRRIWMGPVGRAVFGLARLLGGTPVAGAATTHRATELALGIAADDLFATLPRETRRQLGDVPRIVASLQRDATTLRGALDRLEEALAAVGPAADTAVHAATRTLRDEVLDRHRRVVSSLETMRLNLLRLHAGALKVDGFTTHLDSAQEVAGEVRRLLEARGELERYLHPGRPTPTPA